MKVITAVTALLLMAACAPSPSTPQPTELEGAKARWNARGFADYSFTFRKLCFCPIEVVQFNVVEVRAGKVTKVTPLEGGEPLSPNFTALFNTVEDLFSQLERDFPVPTSDIYERLEVTFDPTLGFPSKINYVGKVNVPDAGATYTLSDVKALE
jgi:hypothetical protein